MATEYHERDYDDEVYEDGYYEEHYEEEELEDDAELGDDDDLDDPDSEARVPMSFACEDCDYRWEDLIVRKKDEYRDDDVDVICPMCGSMNCTQI